MTIDPHPQGSLCCPVRRLRHFDKRAVLEGSPSQIAGLTPVLQQRLITLRGALNEHAL